MLTLGKRSGLEIAEFGETTSAALTCDGSSWLLPPLIGDVVVEASSGVLEFNVGVPIDCWFDEIDLRVSGVALSPSKLTPGLHKVQLHCHELVRNSILFGELWLTGGGRTFKLPFCITVAETNKISFSHTQTFSETAQREWLEKADFIDASTWQMINQEFIARLIELERQILQRPCKRIDLERLEREFCHVLMLFGRRREEVRAREPLLADLPKTREATRSVRIALRRSLAAHEKAAGLVDELRTLVERRFVRDAVAKVNDIGHEVAEFTDLQLGFVMDAENQLNRARRRLHFAGATLVFAILLAVLIIKLSSSP